MLCLLFFYQRDNWFLWYVSGDDPDEEQLTAKIDVLQERLNEKKEQLLERALVWSTVF